MQDRIAEVEQELSRIEREMQLELTGADGRPAGRGPNYLKLEGQRQSILRQLRELRDERSDLRDEGAAGALPARTVGGPGEPFRDPLKDGGQGPWMVPLPSGRFRMGSPDDEPERDAREGPQRWVTVPPFAIGRTEVTFADYDRFAEATGRREPSDKGWGRGERPVINVSWDDAQAYAQWLSERTGEDYRLPSEAEWEYAARAGTLTPFWTGDCIHTDQANYDGNYDYNGCGAKTGVYRGQTVRAGSLPANPFGLHEVAGNVWEWVADCLHADYQGAPTDGRPWLDAAGGRCARRVLRGGGWTTLPRDLRAATRIWGASGEAGGDVGIRLARTP